MIKILIVDDEYLERERLYQILSKALGPEAELRMAVNGRLAVDSAVLWRADLVLMDIEMPGMNGIDAAKNILAQMPDCKIMFVTAYSLFEYAHEAVKLGASDYILKPTDPDDMRQAVLKVLKQIETQRQLASMTPQIDENEDVGGDKNSKLIRQVQKYLEHNYMYDISLDSMGQILQISSSYFSVLFKRYTNTNFLDYLTQLRIEAAKELLRDPLRSATEVAMMVGYADANYFARTFKKKTGMTPTQYRQSCRHGRVGQQ